MLFDNRRGATRLNEVLASLRNASKLYAGRLALSVERLEVVNNDLVALYGRNGSGKSTLLRVLSGLTQLSSGTFETNSRWRRARIAYCPQNGGLYGDLSFNDNIRQVGRRAPLASDYRTQIELFASAEFERVSNVQIQKLSDGYQKLASLAVTLALDAEILILDEPSADLHPAFVQLVADVLKRVSDRYIAIVFADHSDQLRSIAKRQIEIGQDATTQFVG